MNKHTNRFLWDDCQSIEEQRARIFRRWLAEPLGRYDERWDNKRCLELAIEFMIQPLFMRSTDRRLHEYWSDGIPHFECLSRDLADLRFAGTSVCVAKQNYQGFAPFELDISYAAHDSNVPDALRLRFGERDPSLPIAKIPFGAQPYTKQAAIEVYSRRPRRDQDWAVNLVFDPYRCCVFTQNQKN